jgi:hypothetical protein
MDREEFLENFRNQQGMPRLTTEAKSTKTTKSQSGRWDFLYQLEKLKRAKLQEQINKKQQELFEKEISECTFSPKLNKSVSIGYINTSPCPGSHNTTQNYVLATSGSSSRLIDRQKDWGNKKNIKLESIKQQEFIKQNQECIFKPRIVKINK